jgi:hypothetical protein
MLVWLLTGDHLEACRWLLANKGELIVGTVMTLLFVPALYAAWFRVGKPSPATDAGAAPSQSASEAVA